VLVDVPANQRSTHAEDGVTVEVRVFGIEELATQLEEPFTILPMQGFCDKIGANCDEIVSWRGQGLDEVNGIVEQNMKSMAPIR
jgi:hypothetical protein